MARVHFAHVFLELQGLIHFARKSVNEETTFPTGPVLRASSCFDFFQHCVLQQRDGDFHPDDLALFDAGPDFFPELRVFAILLSSEKVTG